MFVEDLRINLAGAFANTFVVRGVAEARLFFLKLVEPSDGGQPHDTRAGCADAGLSGLAGHPHLLRMEEALAPSL